MTSKQLDNEAENPTAEATAPPVANADNTETEAPQEEAPQAQVEAPIETTPEEAMAAKEARIAELEEQVKRVSADFQNFRRRQEEELKRQKVFMREAVFRSLLPILDHLDRTLKACQESDNTEALIQGIQLVDKDARKIFGEHGVEPISTEGQTFDPEFHQAVMMEETDEAPDQSILAEFQTGYKIEDRVLRPSMVKVARNS